MQPLRGRRVLLGITAGIAAYKAAELARQACDAHSTSDKPRFVIGSVGPGTKLVSLGQVDWDTMLASYRDQIRGLLEGGADALIVETCQDILQAKTAIHAARRAFDACGRRVPLASVKARGDRPFLP